MKLRSGRQLPTPTEEQPAFVDFDLFSHFQEMEKTFQRSRLFDWARREQKYNEIREQISILMDLQRALVYIQKAEE